MCQGKRIINHNPSLNLQRLSNCVNLLPYHGGHYFCDISGDISFRKNTSPVKISDKEVENVSSFQFLSVIMRDGLAWSEYVTAVPSESTRDCTDIKCCEVSVSTELCWNSSTGQQ